MENNIKVEYVDINKIKPATYNPRIHDEKMLAQLEKSIKEFGVIDPIIVNSNIERNQILIGGHARYKIAKKLKYKTIPVIYVNLSAEKEKILNIKLNKISGDWDYIKLMELFDENSLLDFGFEEAEIQAIWDETLGSDNDDFDIENELKKIKEPITKRGDLIILGNHRLLCSDSTDPNAVKALFKEERASMIYSDPPFNINLDYNSGVGNKSNYGGNVDDNKSPDEYKKFIRKVLVNAISVSKEDTHIFMWSDEAWVWIFQTIYNELGIKNRRLNIWLKNNSSPTPSVAFNKAIEFCVYGTRGSPYLSDSLKNLNEVVNKELTNGNELYDEITNIWAAKRLASKDYEHPTTKPPELHEKAIKRCTKVGDIIFDSFSGSASTMICAEQLKRRVFSIEISEIFCDLAIRRWEKLTGKKVQIIKNYYEEK